ncbi:MAG: CRISPR-associated endonuclease Cas3'' [Pseudorhodobacter sp.]|nr:CRISPR-associated endonuclease Cas3'' [Pseudorhodobacter sp.]
MPEHLVNVGKLASDRARRFELSQAAFLAGLYHDLGKYDPAFQRKLVGEINRVDHSTAGAVVLLDRAPPSCSGDRVAPRAGAWIETSRR